MNETHSHERSARFRILDANGNRAAEGLRTLEETARFSLSALSLCSRLKRLRHDLTSAMSRLPRIELLRARDTPGDVGTSVTTTSERFRTDQASIVAAASSRVTQALRCLEEHGKAIDVEFAALIEAIRYQAYDACSSLEQICLTGGNQRLHRIQSARLYALVDGDESEDGLAAKIRRLADQSVDVVQLRDARLDDRTLYHRAVAGAAAARDSGVLFIVNDRADLAVASGADGVHVGQEELPVEQVRRIVGPTALIGLSTHDLEQVCQAVDSTADYIGCGPVFPGKTKAFDQYPGCEFLKQVAGQRIAIPAFAIGGIRAANIDQVVATGFRRIAVTAALGEDAEHGECERLIEALSAGKVA